MTNREAFSCYGSSSRADCVLIAAGIDPDLEDQNKLSTAYGMIDAATATSQKVGDTSESIDKASLLAWAKKIFDDEGVDFPLVSSNPVVTGVKWC